MVIVTPPASTITVFRKNVPMWPLVQARAKLSHCGDAGSDHGLDRISLSVLNEDITAHSSGSTTIAAHSSRNPCEKKFTTPNEPRGGLACSGCSSGAVGVATASWVIRRPPSELD